MTRLPISCVLLLSCAALPAQAQAQAQASPDAGVFAVAPLSETKLAEQAGREDLGQIAQSSSNATVAQNSVGANSVTGDAKIDGAAFQNMSGLSMVNVNTGNNVAMNSSMNVNISITPRP